MPNATKKPRKGAGRKTTRLSVTLPTDVHDALEQMAKRQGVSLAWVMRKAAALFATQLRDRTAGGS